MMSQQIAIPGVVRIMEVGPRDGLQNEAVLVPTSDKIEFINNLVEAGIRRIEVSAFVSPQWIPPLADQLEVAMGFNKKSGVSYAALVPNVRGYERAMSTKQIDEVSIVVAASEQHNKKNLNADTRQVMARYAEVAVRAHADRCRFRAYISCVFGCPYEGRVDAGRVLDLALELLDFGAYEISLGDTIGVASPLATLNMLEKILKVIDKSKIALHMHDTRGLALANIWAALTMGIEAFDSSAGGLGGCPYAPGAAGNVATEDLVNMFDSIGVSTGIAVEKVSLASIIMEKVLGKKVPAKMVALCRPTSSR